MNKYNATLHVTEIQDIVDACLSLAEICIRNKEYDRAHRLMDINEHLWSVMRDQRNSQDSSSVQPI